MTRYDAFLIYQVRYKPALSYPLHHTIFTHPQCNTSQSPFINTILPKIGFNRHMPRVVIFGPSHLGGAALADGKVEQAVSHIANKIVALRKNTIVGNKQQSSYIIKKRGWDDQIFHIVDWNNFGKYLSSLPFVKQVNVIKMCHNWQYNHGGAMLFNERETHTCPMGCNEPETTLHHLCCT